METSLSLFLSIITARSLNQSERFPLAKEFFIGKQLRVRLRVRRANLEVNSGRLEALSSSHLKERETYSSVKSLYLRQSPI